MHLSSGLRRATVPAEARTLLLKQVTASLSRTASSPSPFLSLASIINTESAAILCRAEVVNRNAGAVEQKLD